LILLLVTAQAASAQDWAKAKLEKSPRHREWVSVKRWPLVENVRRLSGVEE